MLRSDWMTHQLGRLKSLLGEVVDLRHAADLVEWDERVYMPDAGVTTHGEMQATLRRLAHEKFTSDALGDAVEAAAAETTPLDSTSDDARLVAVTRRDYEKARNVPAEFVAEQAQVTSSAQHAWVQARAASDFAAFLPHLERVLELQRRYVTFFPPAA